MMHQAWSSIEEVPYCFWRSSVKFQGHPAQKIVDFDPDWAFPYYRPVAAFKSLRFALLSSWVPLAWFSSEMLPCEYRKDILFLQTEGLARDYVSPIAKILVLLQSCLTHWGRVTHICVSKLTIIASDNGLSPGRRQAIIWTNAGILLIGPLGTNFSEISIEI